MTNRIGNHQPTARPGFGLIAWLEQTRIELPLKGVECRFDVCGDLLNVELDQVFQQNNQAPLDCLYTFPLPASAAVYRCEMHVNGRIIRAQVQEVERAREIVREKKAAGHRTALVEMERDNLFTLALGNLQPGDVVVIRLAYFETLTRLADWTSLRIPFCPGVRYIPGKPLLRALSGRGVVDDTDQVPDASRISPPRIDQLHPDAAYVAVAGALADPEHRMVDLSSPSHPVLVREGDGGQTVRLAEAKTAPDCDFVLRWTEPPVEGLKPVGWRWRNGNEAYAQVRVQAPPSQEPDPDFAQDVYFLLDRSGSMHGLKWEQTARAFHEFAKQLKPNDRVWATLFETDYQDFAEKPLSAEQVWRDDQAGQLAALGTGGGTEMLPALAHVLQMITRHSANRPSTLLVITDGQVGNESEILDHLRQHPKLRVHTFGIDVAVNDGFLQQMAEQQHGTFHWLSPNDDIVGTVARLADRLRRPVLTNVSVGADWELPNAAPFDLHAGEDRCLCLKTAQPGARVQLTGKLPDGRSQDFEVELIEAQLPALRLLWAKQRIAHLLARKDQAGALALAQAHNLICRGAAFVAWDDAEQVAVSAAGREVYQPAVLSQLFVADRNVLRLACAPTVIPAPPCFPEDDLHSESARYAKASTDFDIDGAVGMDALEELPATAAGSDARNQSYIDALAAIRRKLSKMSRARLERLSRSDFYDWEPTRRLLARLMEIADQVHGTRETLPLIGQLKEYLVGIVGLVIVYPLNCAAGWGLIEVLYEWAIHERGQAESRQRELALLADQLKSVTAKTERLSLLEAWLQTHLKDAPELQRRAAEQLALLQSSAPKAAGQ